MSFYKNFFVLLTMMLSTAFVGSVALAGVREGGAPVSVDSRIKTFVYSPNEIFTVVFNYGYQSYIEFSKGETIRVLALGDNVNWRIKPVDNKLFVMPLEKEGQTNMLIETNKGRSYAFDLVSKAILSNTSTTVVKSEELGKEDSELLDLAYVVRFYYPQSNREFDLKGADVEDISAPSLSHNPHSGEVVIRPNGTIGNYAFTVNSSDKSIVPVKVFDDGFLTYFQFYDNNKIIPKIFTIGRYGKKIPCKMLLLKDYVIIEGVHKQLYLDYGDSNVQVVNSVL